MIISILLIIGGFALLIFGANWMVEGASSLAKKYKISDLAIGLTIVAFGTSAPELVVNSVASYQGYSDIVLGNIIGSNNFNLFIILGIAGLIYPVAVQSSTAWREIPISLVITFVFLILGNEVFFNAVPELARIDGAILLVLFGLFLFYVYHQMKDEGQQEISTVKKSNLRIWMLIIAGLGGLVGGGQLVVDHSIKVATELDISEKIIGLTVVAAGTSLPEMATSVVAAIKKNSDIAIGNVIGSNIFNILLILGISSLIRPVQFNPDFNVDLVILAGGTVFLLIAMVTGKRKKLDRWEAALLFGFYLSYTVYLVWREL